MQWGGWYDNPETGRNQRWFNGVWTDGAEPGQSGGNDFNQDNDKVNAYIDQLMAQARGQRDLIIKKLDAEHKMALGNDDAQTAQFLESVADGLEAKIGRIPYDYQRYTKRELDEYAMGNQSIAENKKLVFDKLAEDERAFDQGLGFEQGNTNRQTVEDLNSRGLMEGQQINGGLNPNASGYNPLVGLSGLAGMTAGGVNQGFSNMNTDNKNAFGLARTGATNEFNQMQRTADFNHTNTMQDLTVDSRRAGLDAQDAYRFGKEGAELGFKGAESALEQQRMALLRANQKLNANNQGRTGQIAGF